MYLQSILQMSDELSLIGVIIMVLIFDIYTQKNNESKYVGMVAMGLFIAHTIFALFLKPAFEISGGMYQHTPMQTLVKSILNIGTILIFMLSYHWLNNENNKIRKGEFYIITLTTLLGMYFMISAGNFVLFYIGIETATIPMATLIAFNKYNFKSIEAGTKFILSSAFASGFSIFGISLIYGSTGTLYFNDIAALLTGKPIELLGFIFFVVGLFFKISLVPFHFWTPDVYEGAPTTITAYLSVISKGSAVYVLFVLLTKVFIAITIEWQQILYALIVISITLANLFAIRQKNIKRFFAYSSISQAGYLMLGVISTTTFGLQSMLFYILIYLFSNLSIFGVISVLENQSGKTMIDDYRGLSKTNPYLSFVMMIGLFSLAGIPPFAGFFSKYFIFSAAAQQGFYILVLIALLNTIVSLYYYLLIIKSMYLLENENPIESHKNNWMIRAALFITTIAALFMGIFNYFMDFIGSF